MEDQNGIDWRVIHGLQEQLSGLNAESVDLSLDIARAARQPIPNQPRIDAMREQLRLVEQRRKIVAQQLTEYQTCRDGSRKRSE